MNLCYIIFVLYSGYVLCSDDDTTKEYLNPNLHDDRVALWTYLFTKLNTLMEQTVNSTQILGNLAKESENMNAKLEDQHKQLIYLKESKEHQKQYLVEDSLEYRKSSNWITILKRFDGSVNFYRNWSAYRYGFGNSPHGEFFLGLEEIHNMTSSAPHELLVVLKDWDNEMRYAHYDLFEIGRAFEGFKLKILGNYQGDAGDALEPHKGMMFSTFDVDNDMDKQPRHNCAIGFRGGWWFKNCYTSHLNGVYDSKGYGILWDTWRPKYSLSYAEMKIRRKEKAN
uniref:Fibrinogen C-terminal domain-containing protein n=1 Tax=Stomoxys calcitrans TaxID=35570 RepID=A0A1I8P0U7_STOCA